MRTFLSNSEALLSLQKVLVSTNALLLIGATYILVWEIANKLNWNKESLVLLILVMASFASSFSWARLEYFRNKLRLEKVKAEKISQKSNLQSKLNQLSFKERDVLNYILAGKSNKEICSKLYIEHSTLKSHINHIYKKLEVKSRKELVLTFQ